MHNNIVFGVIDLYVGSKNESNIIRPYYWLSFICFIYIFRLTLFNRVVLGPIHLIVLFT